MTVALPEQLNEEQLYRYLNAMIKKIFEKIQKNNPQLELTSDAKEALIDTITKSIFNDKNRTEVSREAFEMSPKFVHKLTMALVMTAAAEKHPKLSNKLDDIKKLFESKDIKHEEDLQKKLTPTELKQIQEIKDELRELNKEILTELKTLNLIQPKPDPSGKKREQEVEETFDINTNLLGLINTKETGSIQAVVQQELGNLFGTPCQNPNYEDSFSQLSEQDKTNDNQFGDSMGLNNAARENFETLGVKNPDDDLIEQIHHQYNLDKPIQLKPH